MKIRKVIERDHQALWDIFREVVFNGDSYSQSPTISKEAGLHYWIKEGQHCYVAENEGRVVGAYIIKPNQPDLGSHVANGSFIVHPEARGQNIGTALGQSALEEAKKLGFLAMQFNMVVSTNKGAVALWKKLGFTIIGTVPKAFNHKTLGLVDVHIMHRFL